MPISLKGLWHASAHVLQLDFCSGEQFFKIGVLVKKSSSFHRPLDALESHDNSIQELFGPFGKF